MSERLKRAVQELLTHADVKINGKRVWDIRVLNDRFYARVLAQGSLGLGESYMDGWWECDALEQFFDRVLRAKLDQKVKGSWRLLASGVLAHVQNRQKKSRAFNIAYAHYNKGNDLYAAMLGRTLAYTCAYWKNAKTLDQAQDAKFDLVCKKIGLKKGQRVLDIGCGGGGLAAHAARKYKAHVVGITVSEEQVALAQERCKGLPVEIRLQDYRDVNEQFDHIISLGMFEHVGVKNYRHYMEVAHRCLKDDGLFLLHTIAGNTSVRMTDPWLDKYIFPDSVLPSIAQIGASIEGLFVMEDWHNFGHDYSKTLLAWHANFEKAWPQLKDRYDERFHRMWRYYLLCSTGSFLARKNQLWQVVLSKNGVRGGYVSIR